MKKGDRVWITRWALTQGIYEVPVYKPGQHYVSVDFLQGAFAIGSECFTDKADALDAVEQMRLNAIAAAERKIEKLTLFKVKEIVK